MYRLVAVHNDIEMRTTWIRWCAHISCAVYIKLDVRSFVHTQRSSEANNMIFDDDVFLLVAADDELFLPAFFDKHCQR